MRIPTFCRCTLVMVVWLLLAACGSLGASTVPSTTTQSGAHAKTYQDIVIGFAQIGAESEWRTANTRSIQDTSRRLGVELKLSDAQQQQANQVKAIRSFIAQRVDVIGVSPVVETGWDAVFAEVKQAGIPLILLDRHADVPDNLFSAFIGSDFVQEGQRACVEMAALLHNHGNIVMLDGTVGAAPTIERGTGFRNCARMHPELHMLATQSGDFIRARGKETMATLLKTYGRQINGLFAQNDDMALGAIEAIEAAGLKPGIDIKIVSIDAVRGAFEAMIAGKLNTTIECNPLLGPPFFETALKLANGAPVERWVKSQETVYRQDTAAQELPKRTY